VFYLQDKPGLNYNDPVAIDAEVPLGWWLRDDSCKYILSVFVHKDNKDISTRPTKLPPGPTRASVREMARTSLLKERFEAREQQRAVSLQSDGSVGMDRYGEVEFEAKKAKVDGMRSVIDKNRVDALMTQISVMRSLKEFYINRLGRDEYERQIVNLANQMPGMTAIETPGRGPGTPPFATHEDTGSAIDLQDE
jgi:hypothetical protein